MKQKQILDNLSQGKTSPWLEEARYRIAERERQTEREKRLSEVILVAKFILTFSAVIAAIILSR